MPEFIGKFAFVKAVSVVPSLSGACTSVVGSSALVLYDMKKPATPSLASAARPFFSVVPTHTALAVN